MFADFPTVLTAAIDYLRVNGRAVRRLLCSKSRYTAAVPTVTARSRCVLMYSYSIQSDCCGKRFKVN